MAIKIKIKPAPMAFTRKNLALQAFLLLSVAVLCCRASTTVNLDYVMVLDKLFQQMKSKYLATATEDMRFNIPFKFVNNLMSTAAPLITANVKDQIMNKTLQAGFSGLSGNFKLNDLKNVSLDYRFHFFSTPQYFLVQSHFSSPHHPLTGIKLGL